MGEVITVDHWSFTASHANINNVIWHTYEIKASIEGKDYKTTMRAAEDIVQLCTGPNNYLRLSYNPGLLALLEVVGTELLYIERLVPAA